MQATENTAIAEETARDIFARITGEVGALTRGLLLLMKLALVATLVVLWLVMIDETSGGWSGSDYLNLSLLPFGSVVVMMVLARSESKWAVGLITLAACLLLYPVGLVLYAGGVPERIDASLDLSVRIPLMADALLWRISAGGLAGIGMHYLLARIANALQVRGAFRGALPMLGAADGTDYRDLVEARLERIEGAFASGLGGVRIIAMCATALLGAVVASGASKLYLDDRELLLIHMTVALGAGIVAALLLLPMRLRGAAGLFGMMLLIGAATGLLLEGVGDASAASWRLLWWVMPCALVGFLIGRAVAPLLTGWIYRPVRAHLTGTVEPQPPCPQRALRTCERCGYDLEGLPSARCEACGEDELRCPECGHVQLAGTVLARQLLTLAWWNKALRVARWCIVLPLLVLPLLIWKSLGEFIVRSTDVWAFLAKDMAMIVAVSLMLVLPARLMLMHWRNAWIVVLLLPTVALYSALINRNSASGSLEVMLAMLVVVGVWTIVIPATPLIWSTWLWLMYPEHWRDVWAWQGRPGFTGKADEERWAGGWTLAACAGCGVARIEPGGRALSAARIGIESLVRRATCMSRGLGALAALVVAVIVGCYLIEMFWRHAWPKSDLVICEIVLAGALFGAVLGYCSSARKLFPTGLSLAVVGAAIVGVSWELFGRSSGSSLPIHLSAVIGIFSAAAITGPIYRMLKHVLVGSPPVDAH